MSKFLFSKFRKHTILPVSSTAKFGASAPMTLPSIRRPTVTRYRGFVAILLYRNADTGTMMAAPSMYAAASHCTVETFTPKSLIIG